MIYHITAVFTCCQCAVFGKNGTKIKLKKRDLKTAMFASESTPEEANGKTFINS